MNDPTDFYQNIVASITEPDIKRVAAIMETHVGEKNLIKLQDLVIEVFGEFNSSTERKTREILETLTLEYNMAVCSLSGKPGRWLAIDAMERDASASELEARGNHDLDRARALRRAPVPGRMSTTPRPKQASLWR